MIGTVKIVGLPLEIKLNVLDAKRPLHKIESQLHAQNAKMFIMQAVSA